MTLPHTPGLASQPTQARICEEILRQVAQRGADKSICPSEVARALLPSTESAGGAPMWQSLMGPVRRAAVALAQQGRIDILRKGQPVKPPAEPDGLKGVIRLRWR